MSDHLDDAVGEFLREYNRAMSEYEDGYVDADATLSVVDSHVETLREVYDA